jgi:6-phosphogluconolactonase
VSAADVELQIEEDEAAAAEAVVALLVPLAGNLVLTGGATPRRAYELAAERRRDWGEVGFWWSDERCVPPGDERSNFRLAGESLFDRAERLGPVHRIRGELEPTEAASEYDADLRGERLDLILLGIGPDGHTASLFPRAPSLRERDRLAVDAPAGLEPFVPRVTLTLPAIAGSGLVVFLVTGETKAEAVRRAFAEQPNEATPASLARGRRTLAVLDRAAAAAL